MYLVKVSAKQPLIVLCIILYSVNQASSLQCYVCSSKSDEPCYKDPKKEEFKKECSSGNNVKSASTLQEIANSTFLAVRANISVKSGTEVSKSSDLMECFRATGSGKEGKLIVRGCIDRIYADEYIKQLAIIANATMESMSRCNTDLCNSASNLSVKFSGLIVFLLITFFLIKI